MITAIRENEPLEGKAIYVAHCASCHGLSMEGAPDWQTPDQEGFPPAPPHDETGHTWHHDRDLLIAIMKSGVAEAAGLVIDWIESRWPDEIPARRVP